MPAKAQSESTRDNRMGGTKFSGQSGRQSEADTLDACEYGIRGRCEQDGGLQSQFISIESEALPQVDSGSKGALEGRQTARGRRQCAGSQSDELGSGLIGRANPMAGEEMSKRAGAAAGDLGRTEAIFHEGNGSLTKWRKAAFCLFEKAGKELINQSMNAVGSSGLLTHQVPTAAGKFADLKVDVFVRLFTLCPSGGRLPCGAGAAREEGFCNAEKVEQICAGDLALAVLGRFGRIDAQNQKLPGSQSLSEVGYVRGFIFAAEENVALGNLAPPGRGADLLDKKVDALDGVIDGKRLPEDLTIAIAAERHMLVLGIIQCHTENFAGICRPLE